MNDQHAAEERAERTEVVLEVLEGVLPFVLAELDRTDGLSVVDQAPTEVRVLADRPGAVLGMRTVVAAYLVVALDVRRPRSMLSPDRVRQLTDGVTLARRTARPARFEAVRFSAAGSDSPEFVRLSDALTAATGLPRDDEDGDLLLRFRRRDDRWEALVRLTPRPLSARPWRVADHDAAVNATIAAAIVEASGPTPDDTIVDLTCGSGTIVLERLARGPAARVVAVDIDGDALDRFRANQRAARFKGRVELRHDDLRNLPATGDRFDTLWANLPWGERSGSHSDNDVLYPDVLRTARAIATADARLLVLTQDLRRFDRALTIDGAWRVTERWRFFQKGHRPGLFLLRPA